MPPRISVRTGLQVYESALAIVQPQLDSGKITLLAVTNTRRTPAQPNVPTVQESRLPGADDRRTGRPVRAARHAARSAQTNYVRLRRRRRCDHQGSAGAHRADSQYWRARAFATSIEDQRAKVAKFAETLGIKPMQ